MMRELQHIIDGKRDDLARREQDLEQAKIEGAGMGQCLRIEEHIECLKRKVQVLEMQIDEGSRALQSGADRIVKEEMSDQSTRRPSGQGVPDQQRKGGCASAGHERRWPLPLHVKEGEEESLATVVEIQPPRGKMWETNPDAMEHSLDLHNSVIRQEVCNHAGYEVKTIGDSFMVSFADAVDAVLFGTIVQESLVDVPWPDAPQFGAINDKWDLQRDSSGDVV
eukprot:gene58173-biopygen59938